MNLIAREAGWWTYSAEDAPVLGMPGELWFVWVVLWGVVAPLVTTDRPMAVTIVGFLWLDLIFMPLFDGIVVLNASWVVGDLVAMAVALVPGLFLARWTERSERLFARIALQVLCSVGLFLWMIPSAALAQTGGWSEVLALPGWRLGLVAQATLLPIALGVRAVIEFATRGDGTPVPYDPTKRLVTSGPYAFVRNPMQVAMTVLFVILGVGFRSPWMFFAAVVAWAYSAGLAEWHEGAQLAERFGAEWSNYRGRVRAWIPRLKPVAGPSAILLIAYSCGTCSSIGRWFVRRKPV
ncbi:MAG TPA: isoprenylcysteine carboxylmethyltransferase family protein, partial [Actinomycetota bacterium]|nr:isoprenylcysteine carboxylmethyltransferase family protein [Actinomycetota bacterium]